MELKLSTKWLRHHLDDDENHDFSAGDLALRTHESVSTPAVQGRASPAFGTLVHLWRIDQGMTVKKLAEVAQIDTDEIESIEVEAEYVPEAQTVCSLASVMRVPELKLLTLAGHVVQNDPDLAEHSLSFAANAKQWEHISKEQRTLLKQYIKYLSER
jgi:transcriptional regulator with XRE-family HTH domain